MSKENEWERLIKEAEEQAAKTEQMRRNLQNSGDEKNLKVEKEVPVFGDETKYKLTDNTGARTEVHIKDDGKIEARGEQTELVENIEKGEKIRPQNTSPDAQSDIRRQAYQAIDASFLSETEKAELKQRVERYNFAESKEKPEEMVDNLKTSVDQKEKQEKTEEKEQTPSQKIRQLRGLEENTAQKSAPHGKVRTAAKGLAIATTAQALKNIANGGR